MGRFIVLEIDVHRGRRDENEKVYQLGLVDMSYEKLKLDDRLERYLAL